MASRTKKSTGQKDFSSELKSESAAQSLYLIYGDDDYLVDQEARRVLALLVPKGGTEYGLEVIDGGVSNQGEVTAVFGKLFEALQSQSFFSTEKVIWLKNTNLLGASATASASGTSDFLATLETNLKTGLASGISLVITATEVDGRKGIVKTIQKLGQTVSFKVDPYKQQENEAQAVAFAATTAKELGKKMGDGVDHLIVEMAAGDARTIRSELEKLTSYVGDVDVISEEDVRAIGSWRPGGVVWDLPDAIGNRNLSRALGILDDLFFIGESPIALLFAVISRVRLLLLLSVLAEKKLLRLGGDYNSFKSQLDRLPSWISETLPKDKKLNPLASHPFVLWKAASGASRYTRQELQGGLETLLACNEAMVSSGGDAQELLKEAILKICIK
jgi:DNA polymerase III subunit delta